MYQVIRMTKASEGQQVRAFWVMKTYKTRNGAEKAIATRPSKLDLEKYTFTIREVA